MRRIFELTQWPDAGNPCAPGSSMQEHRENDVPLECAHILADEVYQLFQEISARLGIRAEIRAPIQEYDPRPAAARRAGKEECKAIGQAGASEIESSRAGTLAGTQEAIRELQGELIRARPPAARLVSLVISAAAAELQVLAARNRQ